MYNLYPYDYDYITPIGKQDVTFDSLNAKDYGIIYRWASKDLKVKVYAIAYYPGGIYKEFYADVLIQQNTNGEITGEFVEDAFKEAEDLIVGKPEYIEFIITPFKCAPMKWMLYIKG
jgi:hypothetical protein